MRLRSERRPWGHFTVVHSDRKVTVKILAINPGQSLSLQYHRHRHEFWTWLDGGPVRIQIGDTEFPMEGAIEYSIPPMTRHRIINPGSVVTSILEVARGHFDENDIVRLSDDYGRAK